MTGTLAHHCRRCMCPGECRWWDRCVADDPPPLRRRESDDVREHPVPIERDGAAGTSFGKEDRAPCPARTTDVAAAKKRSNRVATSAREGDIMRGDGEDVLESLLTPC